MKTFLSAVLLAAGVATAAEEIRLVSEKNIPGALAGVTADGKLQFRAAGGDVQEYSGDDVFTVEVNAAPAEVPADGRRIYLADGAGRIRVKTVTLAAGGRMTAESPLFGKIEFGLDAVAAVKFSDDRAPADYEARLAALIAAKGTKDILLALGKDKLLELEGQLRSIGENDLTLNFQGQDRQVTLPKAFAMVVASLKAPASAGKGPDTTAELTDGSRLAGKLVRVTETAFVLSPPGLPEVTLERKSVVRLYFSSGRVVELADLAPTKVVERPFFQTAGVADDTAGKFPRQKDKPVSGRGKLKLDDVEYNSGLGVHSYCELTYQLNGQYEKFTSRIGIDDSVRPAGHVVFIVLLDGKEHLKRPLGGKDPSVAINVPLEGVTTMTLIVDYGEGFDIADHADWAGARLLKKKR